MKFEKINDRTMIIEDAELRWNGFGDEDGKPYVSLYIDDDIAAELMNQDIRVGMVAPRNEGDPVRHTLKVRISFKFASSAPTVMVSTGGRRHIKYTEDMIGELGAVDGRRFGPCSVMFTVQGQRSKKDNLFNCYMKEGWFQIEESRLARKYGYLEEEDYDD